MATKKPENLERLQARFPAGADALLVSSPMHQYYLTGFVYEDGWLCVSKDRACVLTDSRYIEAAQARLGGVFDVRNDPREAAVRAVLNEWGVKTLLFEDRFVTVAGLERMRHAYEGIDLKPVGGLLDEMRVNKTAFEGECLRRAVAIGDRAFEEILGFITPDRTEAEIALELECSMRRQGAGGIAFTTIAISGKKTSMPHGEPENRKIEPGFLTMDFGCKWLGYCSDMTRTVSVGRPTEEMRDVYNTVARAQEAALQVIGPGKRCSDMDRIARDVIDASPYKGTFGHSLGHGVGLQIHERPNLSFRSDVILEAGHVVTVEPGIYLPGKFGVRIEDMVIIREDRAENLTHSRKDLLIL